MFDIVNVSGDSLDINGTSIPAGGKFTVTSVTPSLVALRGIGRVTITAVSGDKFEPVIASQTNQVLGTLGAAGDYLSHLVVTPTTTAAGAISIKDGSGSAYTVFNTGTLADLKPFIIDLRLTSLLGAWQVTTGANVTVLACGRFS